jgi:hypothetical protein
MFVVALLLMISGQYSTSIAKNALHVKIIVIWITVAGE